MSGSERTPTEVLRSWVVMLAHAGLALLYVGATLLSTDALRDHLWAVDPRTTRRAVDAAVTEAIGLSVVVGVLFALLWWWLATRFSGRAHWARVTALVLAGIGILVQLLRLPTYRPLPVRLVDVAWLVADVALAVLLTRPAVRAFCPPQRTRGYRAPGRRRPPVAG